MNDSSELVWQKTTQAWIAARPQDADDRGQLSPERIEASIGALGHHLLTLGGIRVCIPFNEKNASRILHRGRLIPLGQLEYLPGDPGQCHANSARLWQQQRTIYCIATGYALSEADGMRRRHSWLLHRDEHIVETTEPRFLYFGMILSRFERWWFAKNNPSP